ncbi:hypothetical protein FNF27_01915 [Cafeteria roenbergensis]|uniref:SAP domain-containing protein n=1 Tax=Cafeteria roenbergensis TaxID=33653 RepID=A0A5A8EH78_CAFRO|nr:hypothetical protein FNF27_01915 [Cafeteria roenbergensis]
MGDEHANLLRLTKAQLVEACTAIGLPTDGRKADLAARLVAHGEAKEAEDKKPAARASAAKEDAFGPIEDDGGDDSDSPDDVPLDISFAAARQAAIAAEAAEAEATARLARKRRKRPRSSAAKAASKAAEGDDADSDDDLDDALLAAAAEGEHEEKAAAHEDGYSSEDSDEGAALGSKRMAGGAAPGSSKPVVLRARGMPKKTRGPERDDLGRHVVFGDRDDAAEAMAQANVANAAEFLQSHFYGGRLNRQTKPRVGGGRKLGAARGFGTGGDGAKQVRGKQGRRRK